MDLRLAFDLQRGIKYQHMELERELQIATETLAPVRRKPGRPRLGWGAKVISVSIEKELLARSDELARDLGVTRAALISQGLRAMLETHRRR